jgi:hypothetical protein
VSGSLQHDLLHWDLGVFGAETISPDDFEQHLDGIGRIVATPWAWQPSSLLHEAEIGISGRAGWRDARDQTGDAPAITTGQGFALWRPTHVDSLGRTVHVVPDASQLGAGLEIRIPIQGVVFRGETFWMAKDTRETTDPGSASDNARLGALYGLGWYAEISVWPLQLMKLVPPLQLPRSDPMPDHLEVALTAPVPERRGFELAVLGAGINAHYDGASRGGPVDPASANGIELYQIGGAVSYWQSNHLRLTLDGNCYLAPESSSANNGSTVVPGNLGNPASDSSAHTLWEFGARASVMF